MATSIFVPWIRGCRRLDLCNRQRDRRPLKGLRRRARLFRRHPRPHLIGMGELHQWPCGRRGCGPSWVSPDGILGKFWRAPLQLASRYRAPVHCCTIAGRESSCSSKSTVFIYRIEARHWFSVMEEEISRKMLRRLKIPTLHDMLLYKMITQGVDMHHYVFIILSQADNI